MGFARTEGHSSSEGTDGKCDSRGARQPLHASGCVPTYVGLPVLAAGTAIYQLALTKVITGHSNPTIFVTVTPPSARRNVSSTQITSTGDSRSKSYYEKHNLQRKTGNQENG